MTYPAPFHRIVMIGDLFADQFNVTLSMVPGLSGSMPAVTQAHADNVAAAIKAWWPLALGSSLSTGIAVSSAAKLHTVKVNRIGTNGKYLDPVARESTFTPIGGPGTGNVAPQLTIVATLRGANERSHAGKGRMYFPPSQNVGSISTDGRVLAANQDGYAWGVAGLISRLNDVYIAAGINSTVGIASKVGSGAFQSVTKVTVGRVVDTMRSRRNKLPEDPVERAVT